MGVAGSAKRQTRVNVGRLMTLYRQLNADPLTIGLLLFSAAERLVVGDDEASPLAMKSRVPRWATASPVPRAAPRAPAAWAPSADC